MLDKFFDSNFIPDDLFCQAIDDNSYLVVLKSTFDGRICNHYLGKEKVDYLDLLKQTENKFLKLVFFECLKNIKKISIAQQKRILNSEGLTPLFFDVALNIVKQNNSRYRPMWLLGEYIYLTHKSNNQEMFDNLGNILKLIISNKIKAHMQDIYFILKDLLGLKKKILSNVKIPKDICDSIDFWLNEIFDGNLTHYSFTKNLLEKIFDFYEIINSNFDIISKREIIFKKYKQFYDDKIDNNNILNIDNLQSIHSHRLFTETMLDIIHKYCMNEEIKGKLLNILKVKYEELTKNATIAVETLPEIRFTTTIPVEDIEKSLKDFEDDTLQEFMQKIVINDYFLPDVPDLLKEDRDIIDLLPTTVYDDVIRHYKEDDQILKKTFSYKSQVMKCLNIFTHKLRAYDIYEFLGNVYASIHYSNLIDKLSKAMFHTGLSHYERGDFFHCINTIVFQIEGILRTLCEQNGILNLYHNGKKEHPKGLEYMIPKLKEHKVLGDKILFFIEWLLSGSSEIIPENIRNKIAHGISDVDHFKSIYTRYNALSIILIYLSLSKL